MPQRIIAIVMAGFFLGLVGLMASVTLFVRDPLPVLTPRSPASFSAQEAGQMMQARITVDGTYRFDILLASQADPDPPQVALTRPLGDAAPIATEVTALPDGRFQALGQFTTPGRWQISVRHGEATADFPFILQE